MDTTRPPHPTVLPPKVKPAKKLKKMTVQKNNKNQLPQPKALSPISKKENSGNAKQKLYDVYDNFQNYDHKCADAGIRKAEQKQLDVLREMLVKGFAVKNLKSLHNNFIQSTMKKKNDSGKINERGDGHKLNASERTVVAPKMKTNLKKSTSVKKAKPLKKATVKKM